MEANEQTNVDNADNTASPATSGEEVIKKTDEIKPTAASIKSSKVWLVLLLIMIVISLGCASALLYLQITEYNFYLAEPCVWAGKGSAGASFTPQPLPSTITPLASTGAISTAAPITTTPPEQSAVKAETSTPIPGVSAPTPATSAASQPPVESTASASAPITSTSAPQSTTIPPSAAQPSSSTSAPANVSDLLSILGNVSGGK